jgi:succinoglycan biosynthesis transport protein ExoP
MLNSPYREDRRFDRPLLAFAADSREDGTTDGSLLNLAAAEDRDEADPVARHRLARQRREAEQTEPEEGTPSPLRTIEQDGPSGPRVPWFSSRDGDTAQAHGVVEPASRSRTSDARPAARPTRNRVRSAPLVAVWGLIGLAIGGLVATSLPERYEATAQLQLKSGAAAVGARDEPLRVATSGIVLNKVVDKLGLAEDPDFNGDSGDTGLLSLARSLLLRDDGAAASDAGHRHALAASRLANSLSVTRSESGPLIDVTARTGNGEKSALIANTVAEAFVGTVADMQAGPAAEATDGHDEAVRKLDVFLANRGLTSADAVAAADALVKLDDQLSAARTRTAELNDKIGVMRTLTVEAAVGGGVPQEFDSSAMGELRAQYLAIKREVDGAAARLGPRNPERIALETQLDGARKRIGAELRRIVTALQDELKQAVEAEQAVAARLAESKLGAEDITTLRSLRAAVDSAAQAGSGASKGSDEAAQPARIVTRAYAPMEPIGPPRLAITLTGLLLGLAAGVGLGGVRSRRGAEAASRPDAHETRSTAQRDQDTRALDINAVVSTVRQAIPAREPALADIDDPSPSENAEIPDPLETAMYPVYTDPMPSHAHHPGEYPQQYYPPQPYPAQPYMPQPYGQAPMMQPHGGVPYPYAPYWPAPVWQAQPVPAAYHPYPPAPYAPRMATYQQPPALPEPAQGGLDQSSLEEIRASLREFREAVRELAESRSRRRYF